MISVVVMVGVLATYVSGNLQSTSAITPGGTFIWGYGFPFPWTTTVGVLCSSLLSSVETFAVHYDLAYAPCLKSSTTSYDWISFAGDVLFYFAIGYGMILAVRKTWSDAMKRAKKQAEQLRQQGTPEKS